MNPARLASLLEEVASGRLAAVDALARLAHFPSEALAFATIDHHRVLRQGQPEVVFCAGKTVDQVVAICERLAAANGTFLGTRASESQATALTAAHPRLEWNALARTVYLPADPRPAPTGRGTVLVVCAGTSDLPVAEEAAVVAEAFGNPVARLADVGVAGIHRLLAQGDRLREASVIIVVAGMEGALPSVVGGLVRVPVIAVPTSVGYGASFGGVAALLGMLNSCASGVTVVNIDNGFGAAAAASRINQAWGDMQRTVLRVEEPRFEWLDVVNPGREDLEGLASARGLHPAAVQDCLDPEHLPKFEKQGGITFVIVRAADEAADASAVNVQQLTRKVAIFLGPGFLLTIHRKDQPFLLELQQAWSERTTVATPQSGILVDLIGAAIRSYDRPLEQAEQVMDEFEAALFDGKRGAAGLEQIHVVKRRVTVMKRLLWQTLGVVQRLSPPSEGQAPWFQDLREHAESSYAWADEIFDNLNNLLMIQLSLASHRTNEVVRVLTIFSAFFLPLTFIVGIYGMNFDFMPELRWRLGYPAVIAGMLLVCVAIYGWFRRNGWLR